MPITRDEAVLSFHHGIVTMIAARPLALAGLLGAAVGGPYVMTEGPKMWGPNTNADATAASPAGAQAALNYQSPDLSSPTGPGSDIYTSPAPLAGPIGMPLESALDWNITRNWVYRHWARKSTGLADPTLFGVRVPLVTGSGMTDVAGSLTYYFDGDGVLQRMRLNGRTADTSRIVHLAATRFGMQQVSPRTAGNQRFESSDRKNVSGLLRTRPQGTLWATSPHNSFEVRFEATRPGGGLSVTPEQPHFEIPQVAQATPAPPQPPKESPILPPRALVPESPQPAPKQQAAGGNQAASPPQTGGPPALPKLGKPTEAPKADLQPLESHRPRFRWPG